MKIAPLLRVGSFPLCILCSGALCGTAVHADTLYRVEGVPYHTSYKGPNNNVVFVRLDAVRLEVNTNSSVMYVPYPQAPIGLNQANYAGFSLLWAHTLRNSTAVPATEFVIPMAAENFTSYMLNNMDLIAALYASGYSVKIVVAPPHNANRTNN